jgi:pseudouridine-5'-monophosphatase
MNVTHCIFDLDGLLLDTESIYTECLQQLCAPYGKNFSTETKVEIMGKSSLEAGQILIRILEMFMKRLNFVFSFHLPRRFGFTDE